MQKIINWAKSKVWGVVTATLIAVLAFSLGVNATYQPATNSAVVTIGYAYDAFAAGTVDYTYNGTNDNIPFQAALNALPVTGGHIVDVSGVTKHFTAMVTRAIGNVTIEGTGKGSLFANNGVAVIFQPGGNNWVFKDCAFDSLNGINQGVTTGWIEENVWLGALHYAFRSVDGETVAGSLTSANGSFTQLTATTANISTLNAPTGRGATYVIAASDAPANVKAQADYVVTNNASLTVQTALNSLNSSRTSQITIKLIGGFTFSGTVNISSYTTLDLTEANIVLAANNNVALFRNVNWLNPLNDHDIIISGGLLNGNNMNQVVEANDGVISLRYANNSIVTRTTIVNGWGFAGIYFSGANNTISYNYISSINKTNGSYGNGIYLTGATSDFNLVVGNTVENVTGRGVFIEDNSGNNTIINNKFLHIKGSGGVQLNMSDYNIIANNQIWCDAVAQGWGIELEVGSNYNLIKGNIIRNAYYDAIRLYDITETNNIIVNNIIINQQNQGNYGIGLNAPYTTLVGNNIQGKVSIGNTTGNIVYGNQGYTTENSGNFTITAGQWGTVISHGLATNATAVQLTLTSNCTTTVYVPFSVMSSTQFTANLSALQGSDITGTWRAVIGAGN